MITATQLKGLFWKLPAAMLREELAVGLQQETEGERIDIREVLSYSEAMDSFQVVLDAVCNEVIVPGPQDLEASWSLLQLICQHVGAVMAVVERMKRDGLYEPRVDPFYGVFSHCFEKEVEDAVISVLEPSVFGRMGDKEDILGFAVRSYRKVRPRAVEAALKHGPTMEQRLEAGMERFRYVFIAAEESDFKTLQQMHDLLPLLPDGSGRRGELADYAGAIDKAVRCWCCDRGTWLRRCRDNDAWTMLEYLAEQAGDDEVFSFCSPSLLLTLKPFPIERLVERAPQLVEAACKDPDCLSLLANTSHDSYFLVRQMLKLVDPEDLCNMMRQTPPSRWETYSMAVSPNKCEWMKLLKPIHEAFPESMDGLRWKWLVKAIQGKAYTEAEYMLGMCKRRHLVMRDEEGDTAYDMAVRDTSFPRDLRERLKVVHMTKRARE